MTIEFLNTWNDFPVLRNKQVTDTVLVLYSFSMLQFSVVTTKTTDEYVEESDDENVFGSVQDIPTIIKDEPRPISVVGALIG